MILALEIADIRDYILIAFFGSGTILLIFVLLIVFLIYRKIGPLMDAIRGNLEATRSTLGNAAATSTLVSDAVIKPIIKTSSFLFGVKQGVGFLFKLARRGGG